MNPKCPPKVLTDGSFITYSHGHWPNHAAINLLRLVLPLSIVMVIVSARADQAITIKGPLAALGELEAQIRGKSTTLDDLEAE